MTARLDLQPKYAGVCVDCGGRAQPRTNWDVIAPSGRANKPSFHHSCSSSMARGEHARVFSRAGWRVWLKRRGRERQRVCLTCFRLWSEATAVEVEGGNHG